MFLKIRNNKYLKDKETYHVKKLRGINMDCERINKVYDKIKNHSQNSKSYKL